MLKSKRSLGGWRPIAEVAERHERSIKTVQRWMERGLRHVKIGATILIHEEDENAFFESNARGGNIVQRARAE